MAPCFHPAVSLFLHQPFGPVGPIWASTDWFDGPWVGIFGLLDPVSIYQVIPSRKVLGPVKPACSSVSKCLRPQRTSEITWIPLGDDGIESISPFFS